MKLLLFFTPDTRDAYSKSNIGIGVNVYNNIFLGKGLGSSGGMIKSAFNSYPRLRNNVIYDSSPSIPSVKPNYLTSKFYVKWGSSSYTKLNSFESAFASVSGNVNADPMLNRTANVGPIYAISSNRSLAEALAGYYSISSTSPACNAGALLSDTSFIPSPGPGSLDFFGNLIANNNFDIGAHEYWAAPMITTSSLVSGTVGVMYSQQLAASNSPTSWIVTGSLPAGLTLNSVTGLISGTPTTATSASFVVTAKNAGGTSITKALSITIKAAAPVIPVITTTSLPDGMVGTTYSQTLSANPAATSWNITSGNLPGGLTLAINGTLSGTPSAAGTFSFTVTASSGTNMSSPKALSIVVLPSQQTTALPVTNGLALWLDASKLSGVVGNLQQVNTWSDQSGLGNDALRKSGSSAGYPRLATDVINHLPVVQFGSSNLNMGDSLAFTRRLTKIRTAFWVVRESAGASDGHFLLGDSSTYDFHRGLSGNGTIWNSQYTSSFIKAGTTKLMGAVVDGTKTTIPPNAFQVISLTTTGNVRAGQLCQDRVYHGSWQGDVAEIIIYNRVLTSNEELQVGHYLAGKYALGAYVIAN